jgi:pyruvate dehydrogenase E1 component alpha subunit/2-oxoisovalerate dehydrogenase E1 component alpha subunit
VGTTKTTAVEPITTKTSLSEDAQRELLRWMLLTRRLEEKLVNLYRQGKIVGGLYRSLGQEATAVGTAYALEPADYMGPLIRNLGSMLVKGVRPEEMFLQYMARSDSPTGGKDGTNHFGEIGGRNLVSTISQLGSLVAVMGGVALAAKLQKREFVALTYIGDGGASTGEFNEALNFAAVMKTPFVIVIEHNSYAYSTPTRKQTAIDSLAKRAEGFGLPGVTVDGNDVLAVYEVTKVAVDRARAGDGPTLIEPVTYRRKGHAEHDDQRYVSKEEMAYWEARDPIDRYRAALLDRGLLTEDKIEAMEKEIQEQLNQELDRAEKSPMPPAERCLERVYHGIERMPDPRPRIR